jgi:hypothetical protein
MQEKPMKTKVAILGAGCSCAYGYPLANQLRNHLAQFSKTIESSAPKLHKLACNTLELFDQLAAMGCPADTLDDLAWHIDQGKIPAKPGTFQDEHGYRLVEDAKAVVSAMFLSKENDSAAKTLTGYRNLLRKMFLDSMNCDRALRQSPWRVLTFNYDRLFEMAFRQHFKVDPTLPFYGQSVLNSGLYPLARENVEIDTSRFSLLKLHGSAGFSSLDEYGKCNHYHTIPDLRQPVPIVDETFFFGDINHALYSGRIRPSLIVFPHEKGHLKRYPGNKLPWRAYIPQVWNAAHEFVSQAEEIHIIGYSIAQQDWQAFGDLLRTAERCSLIIVKDPKPPKVCQNLNELLPNFKGEIRSVDTAFE